MRRPVYSKTYGRKRVVTLEDIADLLINYGRMRGNTIIIELPTDDPDAEDVYDEVVSTLIRFSARARRAQRR